jgi:hypothetical protein
MARARNYCYSVKNNNAFSVYCWAARKPQQYKNTEFCTELRLWRIHFACNNQTHVDFSSPTYLPDFNQNLEFLDRLSQKSPESNFAETHPMGTVMIHTYWRKTDGQTHMTKLIGAFSNNATVPKKHRLEKEVGKKYDTGSKTISKFVSGVTVRQ